MSDETRRALQRRTMRVLVATQILGGLGVGAGVSVVGLMAFDLAGTETLSGLSASASVVGSAVAAVPLATLSAQRGRRPGLATGYLVGAGGAALAVLASVIEVFPLHVVSSFLFGWATAANLQTRFAATDLAQTHHAARSLSTIVWATTIGAVLGPNLTVPGAAVATWLGLPTLAGPYVFAAVVYVAAAAIHLLLLRPDPLLVARAEAVAGGADDSAEHRARRASTREAWALVRARPTLTLAMSGIASAHAVMVGVMVMTPVHMHHHGASITLVGLTISLHVAGMYALSPLVGRLADRVGALPTLVIGMAQFVIASVLVAFADADGTALFTVGMILLGTGWSCALVSGSAMVTTSVESLERPMVQGLNDLVMNLSGGLAGILAGVVLGLFGYPALALSALMALLLPLAVLMRHARTASAIA